MRNEHCTLLGSSWILGVFVRVICLMCSCLLVGAVWESPEQLSGYEKMMEEAKRRDHRKIGKEMDLFSIQVRQPTFPFLGPGICNVSSGARENLVRVDVGIFFPSLETEACLCSPR